MERALGRARFMWCNVFLALRSWRSQQKQVLQMTTSDGICRMMQLWPCGSGLTQSIDTVYEDRSGKIIILFHDTNRCAILQPKAVNRLLTPFLYYYFVSKIPGTTIVCTVVAELFAALQADTIRRQDKSSGSSLTERRDGHTTKKSRLSKSSSAVQSSST